jgi:hypothetical protein
VHVQLANLGKFQRIEFAAAVISKITGSNIEVMNIPEQLATMLSDRAAGNPKLIMEVLWDLLHGFEGK